MSFPGNETFSVCEGKMSWSSVFGSSSKIKLPGDIILAAKPDGSVKVSESQFK